VTEIPPDGTMRNRWSWDTGIRFCSWNQSREGLLTGSSDGVVKEWNIFKATEDAHIKDIVTLNSPVMSGIFSADFTKLVVGEVNRTVTMLEVAGPAVDYTEGARRGLQSLNVLGSEPAESSSSDGPATSNKTPYVTNHACSIPLCQEVLELTMDGVSECMDLGQSRDRIPANLFSEAPHSDRKQSMLIRNCRECGDPAILGESKCVKCSFACFRCGNRINLRREMVDPEVIACSKCGEKWRAGILGFERVGAGKAAKKGGGGEVVMRDVEVRAIAGAEKAAEDDSNEEGEEGDDHYHSLWEVPLESVRVKQDEE